MSNNEKLPKKCILLPFSIQENFKQEDLPIKESEENTTNLLIKFDETENAENENSTQKHKVPIHSVDENITTDDMPTRTTIGMKFQDMKQKLNLKLDTMDTFKQKACVDNEEQPYILEESGSTPSSVFEEFYSIYRSKQINDELRLLQKNEQDGVYVTPSMKSLQIWYGVIFVRDGLYDEGVFHFSIYFTDNFPAAKPVIKFKTKIFHPQIEPSKGSLNCKSLYVKQNERRIRMWELIRYVRSCFYHLDINDAVNKEAKNLLLNDFGKFKARCRSSVLDSLLEFEERSHQNYEDEAENPLRCNILSDDILKAVKKVLIEKNSMRDDGLYFWAKNQLGRVLNNINSYAAREDEENT